MTNSAAPRGLLLHNCNVVTLDDRFPAASGVLVESGRIVRLVFGPDDARSVGPAVRRVDLDGVTVLPGFIDPHCHPIALGAALRAVDCSPAAVASIPQIVKRLAQAAAAGDGWIRARGYDELLLAERRHPTAADLDRASPHRPVRLTHGSGHGDVLNTAALDAMGITRDTRPPPGCVIERDPATGAPTGVLFEMGAWLRARMPRRSEGEARELAAAAGRAFAAAGMTSLTDAGADNRPGRLSLYEAAGSAGDFPPRVRVMMPATSPSMPPAPGDRVGRAGVKLALTLSGGEPTPGWATLLETMRGAHELGLQIAVHAVEIDAVVLACEAFRQLSGPKPNPVLRHRIEHASECPPFVAEQVRAAGVAVVTQPGFVFARGDRYLAAGAQAAGIEDLYPAASLMAAGVRVAASSDAPVGPHAPLAGIAAAVTRTTARGRPLGASQAVSVETALRMYGPEAAWVSFLEDEAGTLSPGKAADLVVLDADPRAVPGSTIADIAVVATMIGGELVHGSLPGY